MKAHVRKAVAPVVNVMPWYLRVAFFAGYYGAALLDAPRKALRWICELVRYYFGG